MSERPFHVLFLCTGNSARSILAEALLATLGADGFRAHSAGSKPSGRVQPMAAELAVSLGYPARHLRSKSWDEFAQGEGPDMDIVITVCGNAAEEACPAWPGHPVTAHWGVPDPASVEGDDDTRRAAYASALATLRVRVERLVQAPLDRRDPVATRALVRGMGELQAP